MYADDDMNIFDEMIASYDNDVAFEIGEGFEKLCDSQQLSDDCDSLHFDKWTVTSVSQNVVLRPSLLQIKIRSRDEDDVYNNVPESIYTSMSYTLTASIDSTLLLNNEAICMVNASVFTEGPNSVEVRTVTGEAAFQGGSEFITLQLNKDTNRLEAKIPMKWRSGCSSHNFQKKRFFFVINFVECVAGQMQPLLSVDSTPFQCNARRPKLSERTDIKPKYITDKPAPISKKRKTTDKQDMPNKKTKLDLKEDSQHSQDIHMCVKEEVSIDSSQHEFHNFLSYLDQLVASRDRLDPDARQCAMKAAFERLFEGKAPSNVEDPFYADETLF